MNLTCDTCSLEPPAEPFDSCVKCSCAVMLSKGTFRDRDRFYSGATFWTPYISEYARQMNAVAFLAREVA